MRRGPRPSPRGHASQALPKPAPRVLSRQPSKLSDCYQSKQIHALKALTWGLALRRTRTCNLRRRSETQPVCPVVPWTFAAGRVDSAVRLAASRRAPSQRPDCQRDCQPWPARGLQALRFPGQKLWVIRPRRVGLLQVGVTIMRRMVHCGPVGSIGLASWNAATYPACLRCGKAARVQRPYG
jgi:hypothetical protein